MKNSPPEHSPILIYSDGGAIGNPGPGGYGAIVQIDGTELELSQGFRLTTNNRMELLGVITALEHTADKGRSRPTVVTTDSRYVVDAMEKGWAKKWRANGWKRNKRDKALNPDLWAKMLDNAESRTVSFKWVKGHAGHPENERCDALVKLASSASPSEKIEDTGYTGKPAIASVPQPSLISDQMSNPQSEKPITPSLSHVDSSGQARMVDVGPKEITERSATASCEVRMTPETLRLVQAGGIDKGDVIATAKIAGISAAKRTHELIPMCHNIPLSQVDVRIDAMSDGKGLRIAAMAKASWRTGVEMEAMTACSIAALTVYDMCKSAERGITITDLRLRRKSGGKSGDYSAD